MIEFNFSQLELSDNTEFIIFGIPLDCTSATPTDSRNAPDKIRETSNQFADYTELGFDLNKALIFDAGNYDAINNRKHLELDLKEIDKRIDSFLNTKNIRLIVLGGDHFVTYPIFQNLTKKYDNLGLISFDAHLDLYNSWDNQKFSNATVIRRICELNDFNLNNLLFVGIRDVDLEELDYVRKHQINVINSYEISGSNLESILLKNIKSLRANKVKELYVSIDIDALDLSFAPGTGYKIPGGLNYRLLWNCLRFLAKNFNVIGFDLVEVAPSLDIGNLTSIYAARLILEFIGMIKQS